MFIDLLINRQISWSNSYYKIVYLLQIFINCPIIYYYSTIGTDHADTLCTMNNIAVLLSDQENYIEAEKLYEKVFLGFSKIFGSEHTETKRAKNNLALLQKKKKTSSLESNFDLSKEIEISKFSKDNKSEEQTVEFVKETFSLNQPAKMKKSKEKNRERESDWITNLKKKMKN